MRSQPAYPQDDDPLCCCEYRNRHGYRAHVCGCCCACDEIDQTADKLLNGERISGDHIDEILREIDDRIRVPLPGGAYVIGLAGAVPWTLLPFLLIMAALSARCLLGVACAMLPAIYWWHRRTLRLRRRSTFLLWWMLASIGWESLFYALVLLPTQPRTATAAFAIPLSLTLTFFMACKRIDSTSVSGVADKPGALARAVHCAVCAVSVPRYDHYCSA